MLTDTDHEESGRKKQNKAVSTELPNFPGQNQDLDHLNLSQHEIVNSSSDIETDRNLEQSQGPSYNYQFQEDFQGNVLLMSQTVPTAGESYFQENSGGYFPHPVDNTAKSKNLIYT